VERLLEPGAGFTNFTKFLIRILLSFYHVAQAPRRTLLGLYQHIPTNSVGEPGPRSSTRQTDTSRSSQSQDSVNYNGRSWRKSFVEHQQHFCNLWTQSASNIIMYVNNVLIHTATHEAHVAHLRHAIEGRHKAGLALNPKKCIFGSTTARTPKSKNKSRQNPNFHRRPVLATFTSMTVLPSQS
jgi:hypothetical protein